STWLPRGLTKDDKAIPIEPAVTAATTAAVVSPPPVETAAPVFRLPETGIDLEQVELSLVCQAMECSQGNQTRAAELLSISRDQLRYRLKKIEEFQPEA